MGRWCAASAALAREVAPPAVGADPAPRATSTSRPAAVSCSSSARCLSPVPGFVAETGVLQDAPYWLEWWTADPEVGADSCRRLAADTDPSSVGFRDYTELPWFVTPRETRRDAHDRPVRRLRLHRPAHPHRDHAGRRRRSPSSASPASTCWPRPSSASSSPTSTRRPAPSSSSTGWAGSSRRRTPGTSPATSCAVCPTTRGSRAVAVEGTRRPGRRCRVATFPWPSWPRPEPTPGAEPGPPASEVGAQVAAPASRVPSRPVRGPSPSHHNRSGARVKFPGWGGKVGTGQVARRVIWGARRMPAAAIAAATRGTSSPTTRSDCHGRTRIEPSAVGAPVSGS